MESSTLITITLTASVAILTAAATRPATFLSCWKILAGVLALVVGMYLGYVLATYRFLLEMAFIPIVHFPKENIPGIAEIGMDTLRTAHEHYKKAMDSMTTSTACTASFVLVSLGSAFFAYRAVLIESPESEPSQYPRTIYTENHNRPGNRAIAVARIRARRLERTRLRTRS